jgi:CRISPR system Cascade subunit CasE
MYISKVEFDITKRNMHLFMAISDTYRMHKLISKAFPDKKDGGCGKILHRLEDRTITLFVVSEKKPDWTKLGYAVKDAQCKEFDPVFRQGEVLKFKIRANPVIRSNGGRKREGLFNVDEQINWLMRQAKRCGFEIEAPRINSSRMNKTKKGTHLFVDFMGFLKIIDVEKFTKAIREGIGSAKPFGAGLLCVSKVA